MRKICQSCAKFCANILSVSVKKKTKNLDISHVKRGKARYESCAGKQHHILIHGAWRTMPRMIIHFRLWDPSQNGGFWVVPQSQIAYRLAVSILHTVGDLPEFSCEPSQ